MQKVSSLVSKDIGSYLSNRASWNIFYNAKNEGLAGNGTTDDYADLSTLINTTIGGDEATIIFPPGTYKISTSITVPSNISLYFVKGAMLSPDGGVTVTINGPLEAGMWQIFTGSGTIAGSMKVVIDAAMFGVKASNADNAQFLQNAINALNSYTYSAFNTTSMPDRGGTILLPAGVLNCSGVTYKSTIEFKGQGIYATRINPVKKADNTYNTFLFMRDYTAGQIGRSAKTVFRDLTISPFNNVFVYTTQLEPKPLIGAIDASYSGSFYIENVCINNLAGTGILLEQCFDSYFDGIEMFHTGDDSANPALAIYSGNKNGVTDTSNALHFTKCRFEECDLIDIDGSKAGVISAVREVQFVACKFEKVHFNIKQVAAITFSASHFTWNRNDMKMMTIGSSTTDTRNLQFDGCTFITGTQYVGMMMELIGAATYDVKIVGGAASSINQLVTGGSRVQVIGLSAVNVGTPFIDNITKSTVLGCTFYQTDNVDYCIKGNNRNKISHNHFERIDKGISVAEENHIVLNTMSAINASGSTAIYLTNGANTLLNNKPEGYAKNVDYSNAAFAVSTHTSTYRTSPVPTHYNESGALVIGLNNAYSTALTLVSGSGYDYSSIPKIRINLAGTFGAETVTVKVQFNYDDASNLSIEKTFTATGNTWIADDDYINLVASRKNLQSVVFTAKTSLSSTSVTGTIRFLSTIH